MSRILLIDGDCLTFSQAAGYEVRSINVLSKTTGQSKSFKNRTEFQGFLKEHSFEYNPDLYEITDVQTPRKVEYLYKGLEDHIIGMRDMFFADTVEIWISAPGGSFREKLPLPTLYKSNRKDVIKPLLLPKARTYLQQFWSAQSAPGIETDDVVTIRAYDELAKGNEVCISTIDKDAYQTIGASILNWYPEEWVLDYIDPDSLGFIKEDGQKTKGSGYLFLMYQMLQGDIVDVYKPFELSGKRYGPTNACKVLRPYYGLNADALPELGKAVLKEYRRLYPKPVTYTDCFGQEHTATAEDIIDLYWKCAYMQRKHNDDCSFWEYCKIDRNAV